MALLLKLEELKEKKEKKKKKKNGQQDVGEAFANLAAQLRTVSTFMAARDISNSVSVFEGEPSKFRAWIKEIEKSALFSGAQDESKKLIAFRASKGPTSDFIDRFLRERPQATWGEMKQELTVRFSEIVDQQHALTLLRKIKQKPREPIHLFAERLFTLSEDAFERDGVGVLGPGAEQQLVAYFIDGLLDYHLKAKILRENPATFRAAVTCAANEQNVQDRIQLRLGKPVREKERVDIFQGNRGEPVRREEPMEVGHMRPLRCFKCGGPHRARDCREPVTVPAGDVPRERKDRSVQCWECGGPHFRRDRKNRSSKNGQHLH